ncbi:MAG: hypothetical protein BroJett025_01690 [Patescibacteria group bacterium]|nr:MAG: hypothetical protein BroJett025_01690 [Patescibacteria group bacterium]
MKQRIETNESYEQHRQERSKLFLESLKHIEVGKNPPFLVCIIGPNRSGTTALSELFARLSIPNYLQPIKSIRRAIEEKDAIPTFALKQGIPLAIVKETFGSKKESEFFNPIETLIAAGYPPERIHLIAMLRNPEMTLTSWNRIYQSNVNTQGLVRAIQETDNIVQAAKAQGIMVTHYVHEAIRDNDAQKVATALFKRIGITLPQERVSHAVDWTTGPRFGSTQSTDIFFDQPPEIFVQGVKERPGYQFDHKQQVNVTKEQRELLRTAGTYQIYNKFKAATKKDINLKIR